MSNTGTLIHMTPLQDQDDGLAWVDRAGGEQSFPASLYGVVTPRVSGNGERVAVRSRNDGNDIWTFEVARGALARQTFEPGEDETPTWSPDGQWLAYASTRGQERTVFRRRVDGSGTEEALWTASDSEIHNHVSDWTSDGRMLLVDASFNRTGIYDIFILPVEGDRTPKPLLATRFNEWGARVSPNGRWLAYVSNESGRDEVYVRPFPSMGGKWTVSTGGGSQPVWSRRGDELFYRGEGSMMAVRIVSEPSFSASTPRKLFDDQFVGGGIRVLASEVLTRYDVAPDGRFLMVKQSASAPTVAQIVVVQNWFEELKRLAPGSIQ
jgi:serine/threonine-protein kinase